ncbi:cytochrome b5-like heme/steroid binding domain-containing protein [Entophlyctis helioformis]|nr:cytochrome b5-like heme/steroid binding domain-containing protein [Entophlyctis helioformis]
MFPMLGGPQRVSSSSDRSSTAPGIARLGSSAPRRKVPLEPGHSPLDWAKLKASGADLRAGHTQLARFTLADLAQHRSRDDLWMAVHGKVYNVTPYVGFHPGGNGQLMRGAGKDATELLMKVHPWVNVDMVLDKCWIGYLVKS